MFVVPAFIFNTLDKVMPGHHVRRARIHIQHAREGNASASVFPVADSLRF